MLWLGRADVVDVDVACGEECSCWHCLILLSCEYVVAAGCSLASSSCFS